MNSKLRTNEEIYSQSNKDYHKDISVLCDLQINFIKSVPLDYMHGIIRNNKTFIGILDERKSRIRLFKEDIDAINERIKLIYKSTSREFSRKINNGI